MKVFVFFLEHLSHFNFDMTRMPEQNALEAFSNPCMESPKMEVRDRTIGIIMLWGRPTIYLFSVHRQIFLVKWSNPKMHRHFFGNNGWAQENLLYLLMQVQLYVHRSECHKELHYVLLLINTWYILCFTTLHKEMIYMIDLTLYPLSYLRPSIATVSIWVHW